MYHPVHCALEEAEALVSSNGIRLNSKMASEGCFVSILWNLPVATFGIQSQKQVVGIFYCGRINSFKTALSVHPCFCGRDIFKNVLFMTSHNSYLGLRLVPLK